MSAPAPRAGEGAVTTRVGFRFSADGRRAVCLAADELGRHYAENWSLHGDGPRLDFSAELRCDPTYTMVLPVDSRRMLISWHGAADSQTVELLDRDGRRSTVGSVCGPPLRLLPAPAGTGCLALAWSSGDAAEAGSMVYRVHDTAPWLREVTRLPGPVADATACGPRVLLTLGSASGRVHMLADPRSATTQAVAFLDGASRVLAAAGQHVLLASRGPAGAVLTLADLDAGSRRPLEPRDRPRGEVFPVALDPTGTTVAVVETLGARSLLCHWDTGTGAVRRIGLPQGELLPLAAWTAAGLWIPYSAPDRPRTLAWLPAHSGALHIPVPRTGPWRPGRLESFPGADGPVEAVVYGPDWRTSPRVVVALHGGPTSRWSLGFQPLFQALAAAGIAVVAPNQRGSTGYGAAHTLAVAGAWGVPDLADIAALGAFVGDQRADHLDRPAVYGISYGGYLALLAAGTQPGTWSSCVAVAPFLSGPRLHTDGFESVRGMVRRLDGLTEASDALGPRDVERFLPRLRARLLLIHGAADESTPVSHSRALAARLTAMGRREGRDFHYLEIPDRGHAALGTAVRDPVTAMVTRFLAEGDDAAHQDIRCAAERR